MGHRRPGEVHGNHRRLLQGIVRRNYSVRHNKQGQLQERDNELVHAAEREPLEGDISNANREQEGPRRRKASHRKGGEKLRGKQQHDVYRDFGTFGGEYPKSLRAFNERSLRKKQN